MADQLRCNACGEFEAAEADDLLRVTVTTSSSGHPPSDLVRFERFHRGCWQQQFEQMAAEPPKEIA